MARKKNTFTFDNQNDHGAAFFGREAGPSATPIPFAHSISRAGGSSTISGSVDAGRSAIAAAATTFPVLVAAFTTPVSPGQSVAGKSLNPINPPARAATVAPGTRAAVHDQPSGPGAVTASSLPPGHGKLGSSPGPDFVDNYPPTPVPTRNRRPGPQVD